jgi:hypothetical protein
LEGVDFDLMRGAGLSASSERAPFPTGDAMNDIDNPENERPDTVQAQIRKMLGVGKFTPAPEGFNPMEATPRQLRAYGYPARPDAERHPRLHEQWTRVMSRPMRVIEPQFAVMKDKGHGSRQAYGLPAGNGWGGSIAFAAKGDTVTFVSGQWTVPHIAAPKFGPCMCANWIGIDGANDDPNGNDSYDILQVGTTQLIWGPFGGLPFSFAWVEWYPELSTEITNLAVSPGDIMYCVICVYSPTEAGIHLLNVTTGIETSFPKTAPGTVELVGNCAEWVIEDIVDSNTNLGRFGDVYFDECVAGTRGGHLLTAGKGTLLPMYDRDGRNIATPYAETDLLIRIQYTDQAP